MSVTISWEGDMRFRARSEDGHELAFDGTREVAASPTEGLLASLGACMAIDVVDILEKGRQDVDRCDVELKGERRKDPPRRFTRIGMEFRLVGKDWRWPLDWSPEAFTPWLHQAKAFARLSTRGKAAEPTLITTGTGSGKTESFL